MPARSLVSIALAAAMLACGQHDQERELETETAVAVRVEAAILGDIHAVVHATGTVTPESGADWTITAPLPARIVEITKAEGDPVREGEVLVRFQIPSLGADLAARMADLAKAKVRAETAAAALERNRSLVQRGIAPRKDIEEAERESADAQSALAEAGPSLDAAQALAGRAVVRARFDGIVARRWHNAGDLVDATSGDPILRVVDPRHLQVAVSVPAGELRRFGTGSAARVFAPGPGGEPEPARVAGGAGVVDPASGTASIRLTFAASRLAVGTAVRVEIDAEESHGAVLVADEAVVAEGEQYFVCIVGRDLLAHRKAVKVGIVAGGHAEILEGIEAGDSVIVHGQSALPDGAAVTVEK